jgi:hypothetical protein
MLFIAEKPEQAQELGLVGQHSLLRQGPNKIIAKAIKSPVVRLNLPSDKTA